jgi:hypothetical protein
MSTAVDHTEFNPNMKGITVKHRNDIKEQSPYNPYVPQANLRPGAGVHGAIVVELHASIQAGAKARDLELHKEAVQLQDTTDFAEFRWLMMQIGNLYFNRRLPLRLGRELEKWLLQFCK